MAYQPGEVFSWNITKLAGPRKGTYFDAYVMIDIYSRYIVGCQVHLRESGALAEAFMKQAFAQDQVPQVVHADYAEENAKPTNQRQVHAKREIRILSSA